ncbi:MAG: choice-of-anchor D domain-containing protein [Bacteroidota bacterium]
MRPSRLILLPIAIFLLFPAVPASAQLFMQEVVVFAVDTLPVQSVFLSRSKNYDIMCSETYSFWRDAQYDSIGLADAAYYRDIPPGEFGFPGLSTSGTNGFLVNGQPISSRISPSGPSPSYSYRLPFIGLGAPLTLIIEDHPPLSIDRHADNTGAIRVRIYNVSPEIRIDSSAINFGEVELGAFRDTVIVFENEGYGALRLEELTIGGADAGEFQYMGSSSFILQPGERDSFTLRFTPTSVFLKTAFLECSSTDSDSRVIRIPLNGTGVTTLEAGCENNLRAQAQEQNLIPVTLYSNRIGSNTTSYSFEIEYDRRLLLPIGVEVRGTLSESFSTAMTVVAPGRLLVTATNGTALTGTGTLLFLRAWAVWENPPLSPLKMQNLVFNAGNPRALMVDGSVAIDSICNQYLKNVSYTAPPVLRQNRPNPFNPSTIIDFSLSAAADIRLDVYSASGQHVATLAQGHFTAGDHSVDFLASGLPSGLYLYRLSSGSFATTRSMLLLR